MSPEVPHHTVFPHDPVQTRRKRGVLYEFARWLCLQFLKLNGWKMRGQMPNDIDKFVLVAAPHTSNWDGAFMLMMAAYFRTPIRWMGKAGLAKNFWIGWYMRWLGIVPVDRKKSDSLVDQMAKAFAEEDGELLLAVPPEGTRAKVTKWKTGFYHIAVAADVPIVMSVLDYKTKTGTISGIIYPTGDYEADLPLIQSHYAEAVGRWDLRQDRKDRGTGKRKQS